MKPDRALLLHCLRAMCHASWAEQVKQMLDDGMHIDNVYEQIPGPDIRYQLGLCAAAEHSRKRALQCPGTARGRHFAEMELELLDMAGVDVDQWEATR